MAFTYKSIGNTAAAVVSLLAVGTLCWWQRSPTVLDAPRPQDEAEIMTAILERHYAMGRTNTQFTQARAAYVSQVPDTNAVGGVRYVTNSAAYTLTNTIGFFPNATFAYPQGVRDAITPGSRPYSLYPYASDNGYGFYQYALSANAYSNAGEHWTLQDKHLGGLSLEYLDINTNWWTNYVTLATATRLTTAFTNIPNTNFSVRTGWRAASTLSDGAIYYVKDFTDNVLVSWPKDFVFSGPVPDEFYYDTVFQIADIFGSGDSIGFYWAALNWEGMDMPEALQWIASGPMTDFSSSLPAYLTCSFGSGDVTIEYGTWTNVTAVEGWTATSTIITNGGFYCGRRTLTGENVQWAPGTVFSNLPSNLPKFKILDAFTPSKTLSIHKFSSYFESFVGNYWQGKSTGTNLPATLRPYTGWEGEITINYGMHTSYSSYIQPYLVTNVTQSNTWLGKVFAFERDAKPYTWSTNAYNDLARALSSMQWQRRNTFAECVFLYVVGSKGPSDTDPVASGNNISPIYFDPDNHNAISAFAEGGYWSGSWKLHLCAVVHRSTFSNDTPFTLSDLQFDDLFATNTAYTRDISTDAAPGCKGLPSGEGSPAVSFSNNVFTLLPGQVATSRWATASQWSGSSIEEIVGKMCDTATNWINSCIDRGDTPDYYGASYNMWSNATDNAQIPQFGVPSIRPSVTYRVQFSALTNYLDHAPAR